MDYVDVIKRDIPIKFINATGKVDFDVVIFSKTFSNNGVPMFVAWQILRCQTSVNLLYPHDVEVGSSFTHGIQFVNCGPFSTQVGTTWEIRQEPKASIPILIQKTGVVMNTDYSIVVKNVPPKDWNGRMYDIGLYKLNYLLVVHKDLHVGEQAEFLLDNKLSFGVSTNIKIGDVFTNIDSIRHYSEFDLDKFPYGMKVTLNEEPGGGRYSFTAQLMEDTLY